MAEREWSVKESGGDSGQALIDEQVEYAKYLAKKLEQPELPEEVMKQAYSDFISWFKVEDDALKTGTMQYCRYDGGRESTTLKPCQIVGWVILDGIGGRITHKTVKTDDGVVIQTVEEVPAE